MALGHSKTAESFFLPHTVEGDTVTFKITEDKTKFVYGEVIDIVESSDHRIEPTALT